MKNKCVFREEHRGGFSPPNETGSEPPDFGLIWRRLDRLKPGQIRFAKRKDEYGKRNRGNKIVVGGDEEQVAAITQGGAKCQSFKLLREVISAKLEFLVQ